jgi:hypothetical protein
METRADRQRHFAESLEQTRKMLALKDMNYGNVVIRQVNSFIFKRNGCDSFFFLLHHDLMWIFPPLQIRRAQRTGILNLKGSGLRSVPPEVATLEDLRIADLRDNGCARRTGDLRDFFSFFFLQARQN